MNYLVHCFLSNVSDEALVGNLFGDFVKGRLENTAFSGEFLKGLKLHRQIDSFADQHPAVLRSKKRLPDKFRRFSGIILDIYYDHLMALNWDDYSVASLPIFAKSVYKAVEKYKKLVPQSGVWLAEAIVRDDWLTRYKEVRGIEQTLQRFSGYLPYENPIAEALPELQKNFRGLQDDFRDFMPDIQNFLIPLYYTP